MSRPHDHLDAWSGRLSALERGRPTITLRAPIRRAQSSGAGAFLGIADDGRQYWFKVPENPQGNHVLANEVIVERVGSLIGAPVCSRSLAWVTPTAMAWEEYPVRAASRPVVAHASAHVMGAVDDDVLGHTRSDDNARRQASLLALWDLCVGEDEQWLYEAARSSSVWSYDHGLWFTTGEGNWDREVLGRLVDLNGAFPNPPKGLSTKRLMEVADRIEAISRDELLRAVSEVPVEWGIADCDLEAMAWLIYRRAPGVAARTRALGSSSRTDRTGQRS